jgi:hypothetical protein
MSLSSAQPVADVFVDGERIEQGGLLEQHADAGPDASFLFTLSSALTVDEFGRCRVSTAESTSGRSTSPRRAERIFMPPTESWLTSRKTTWS